MKISVPVAVIVTACVVATCLLPWGSERQTCAIRVYVSPELADEIEVEEWAGLSLKQRRHADGTLEYFGKSMSRPRIRTPRSATRSPRARGDAGVRVTGWLRQPMVISENAPEGHEVVVRLRDDRPPEVFTRPEQ